MTGIAGSAECVVIYSADGAKICLKSISASPSIGGITIRKENCAYFSFELPNKSPVAIVVPERDKPGSTAHACAIPIMNA